MSKPFLNLPPGERMNGFRNAAQELGQEAIILGKDVWLCWTLQALFSMPNAHPMAFKGGTSLSKVYGAINRFSEDVDITLDYRAFNDDFDPFAEGASRNATKKFSERLRDYVLQYSTGVIVPYIDARMKTLCRPGEYRIEVSEDGEKIWIEYPSVVKGSQQYLEKRILVELGGRNVIDPNERHIVRPDISAVTANLDLPACEVVVFSPQRTFWEKAVLMHVQSNRQALKAKSYRLSRHWYDLHRLAGHESGKAALDNRALLEDVVRHNQVFFRASYANYEACLNGEFRLIPNERAITELRADYDNMVGTGMIYDQPPPFDEIIGGLREIEHKINAGPLMKPQASGPVMRF